MQTLNELETAPIPIEEEESRHSRRLLVGFLCALLLTGAVLGGYLYLRKRHERQVAAAQVVENKKRVTRVEVFVDEATVNGKTNILGGTIHNISNEALRNVAVELQLRRRGGAGVETRAVKPQTTEIPPDGTARYSLELPVETYASATFFKVVAGDDHAEVAFKALPGAARPPLPAPASKSIIVSRPVPKGEEFINTPNTPGRIP